MTSYFLGIDIGATKTDALIADESGRALGYGRSGPGNQQTVGYHGMAGVMQRATSQALEMAGLRTEDLAAAGFGIGGYDWPSQRTKMVDTIRQSLGLSVPISVVNDAVLGLVAGTEDGWGVAIVAGTSNNCRGRDRHGREGRVTGDGQMFGEYAGAHELVMKALHAVTAQWSMRGPQTTLAGAFIRHVGASGLDDLIEGLALGRYHLRPDAAPLVFAVAQEGDAVARGVIEWAGHELGDLAVGVIRQLNFENLQFDVVLIGSLFNGGPLLTDAVRRTVCAIAPDAHLKRLAAPPVIGAVLLGMEQLDFDTHNARHALIDTTPELLKAPRSAETLI